MKTQIIPTTFLDLYNEKQRVSLEKQINRLKRNPPDVESLASALIESAFYSSKIDGNPIELGQYLPYHFSGVLPISRPVLSKTELSMIEAAVASCNIEGNPITLEEYLKYYFDGLNSTMKFLEIKEIFTAYQFAQNNDLTVSNFYMTHRLLSNTLIDEEEFRGNNRKGEAGVYFEKKLIYRATPVAEVETEMKKLFSDIETLLKHDLSVAETFNFASLIHLILIHIHPFTKGNGIAGRLLQKWFLAQKIGPVAWFIPSEKLYQTRIRKYYENINLGVDYDHVNYELSMPFLLMLPMALTAKQ